MGTETFETAPAPGPTTDPTGDPGTTLPARHPVNVGHLVMGVALAGLTVVWALVAFDVVADDDIRWLLPVPWVLAGAAGLVGLVAADRRRAARRRAGTMEA
ncbi:hypothetical protein [Nocardioides litoris]|uniref:hypothetical protein n=1 Tax=Nocardioides litoris TaxID=1926648 RepID=UPI00111FD0C7|nr:hypothetical protein [Nocardioides litoris]